MTKVSTHATNPHKLNADWDLLQHISWGDYQFDYKRDMNLIAIINYLKLELKLEIHKAGQSEMHAWTIQFRQSKVIKANYSFIIHLIYWTGVGHYNSEHATKE